MKMSAATSPTNKAAIASIVSMMRSMTLRFMAKRWSEPGAVLGQRLLEFLVERVGVAAALGDGVGPLLLQRLGRGLPCLHLVGRQRVDLVACRRPHLVAARRL